MKSLFFTIVALLIPTFCGVSATHAGDEIFWDGDSVRVTYQYRMPNVRNWTNSNAVIRNATTESMIRNQLSNRHRNAEIRILSAQAGSTQRSLVSYQYKTQEAKSWTSGSATLTDARTENMAINQLQAKHPDCTIRILSMKHK